MEDIYGKSRHYGLNMVTTPLQFLPSRTGIYLSSFILVVVLGFGLRA
jgi:hypothetical protein